MYNAHSQQHQNQQEMVNRKRKIDWSQQPQSSGSPPNYHESLQANSPSEPKISYVQPKERRKSQGKFFNESNFRSHTILPKKKSHSSKLFIKKR